MSSFSPLVRRLAAMAGGLVVREAMKRVGARNSGGRRGGPADSRSDAQVLDDARSTSDVLPRTPLRRGEDTASARPQVEYAPVRDGDADPGEIVWTWVPYEDDPSQGKDRPVLVVGRMGDEVAALALTSKPHDDRHHHPVGVWDTGDGRQSWVKLDRVLRLDPDGIRREGAVLDRQRFDAAVAAWRAW